LHKKRDGSLQPTLTIFFYPGFTSIVILQQIKNGHNKYIL